MNYIQSVCLHNFQKHKDLHIDMEDINVITGSSDAGKSSIIRALYWLFFNRPKGVDFYKRTGTKEFWVEVILKNGTRIRRGRNTKESYYLLNDERFVAVGMDIPKAVQDAITLLPLNFSNQHDSFFLLSQSKPEASRYILSLVGLDNMGNALRVAEGRRRKLTSQMATKEQELEELNEEQVRLRNVPEMSTRIKELSKKQTLIDTAKQTIVNLSSIISDIEEVEQGVIPIEEIDTLLSSINEYTILHDAIHELQSVINTYASISITYTQYVLDTVEKRLSLLCTLHTALLLQSTNKSNLVQCLQLIHDATSEVHTYEKEYTDMQRIWDKEMEGNCPVCGHKLQKGDICC